MALSRGQLQRRALKFVGNVGDVTTHKSSPPARLVEPRPRPRAAVRVSPESDDAPTDTSLRAQRTFIEQRIAQERDASHPAGERGAWHGGFRRAIGHRPVDPKSTSAVDTDASHARGLALWRYFAGRVTGRGGTE